MKVSVVIPVYNEEKYIARCLTSLMRQDEYPDEIIVVDNNCTDRTVEICKQFPVRIIKESTQSLIAARNKGFDSAHYNIIARCDADSLIPQNWVANIKKDFAEFSIDALVGPISFFDLPFKSSVYAKTYLKFLRMVKRHHILIGPNMVLTKHMWVKVRDEVCLNDRRVHEDVDLALHIQHAGGYIHYDPKLLVKISGRRIKKNPLSFFIEYPFRNVRTLSNH